MHDCGVEGVGYVPDETQFETTRVGLSVIARNHHNSMNDTWAAAGSVDTDLSFLSSLELYGTEIAERRMPTRRVVEALDVIEHV